TSLDNRSLPTEPEKKASTTRFPVPPFWRRRELRKFYAASIPDNRSIVGWKSSPEDTYPTIGREALSPMTSAPTELIGSNWKNRGVATHPNKCLICCGPTI